jgi:type 1 glutamine amidotransferase
MMMQRNIYILMVFLLLPLKSCKMETTKILIFNKANGFVHKSIEAGTEAIISLQETYPFTITTSNDSLVFRDSILTNYDVILFMSTSGVIFDDEGRVAFQKFIRDGGGFVGVHGASTTEYDWAWFGKMIGNHFDDHPKIQKAKLQILKNDEPSTKHLQSIWDWEDEWYNWRNEFDPNVEVLITVDEKTYEGGKHGDFHPISWRQEFEGGRSWYTAIGHEIESYNDANFMQHIAGGIIWVSKK